MPNGRRYHGPHMIGAGTYGTWTVNSLDSTGLEATNGRDGLRRSATGMLDGLNAVSVRADSAGRYCGGCHHRHGRRFQARYQHPAIWHVSEPGQPTGGIGDIGGERSADSAALHPSHSFAVGAWLRFNHCSGSACTAEHILNGVSVGRKDKRGLAGTDRYYCCLMGCGYHPTEFLEPNRLSQPGDLEDPDPVADSGLLTDGRRGAYRPR